MTAAVLTIGTELLRGRIVNTNAAWISQRLTELGIDVVYQATVGDHIDEIVDVLQRATSVSKVVIVTGGLGPTQDDLARESLAELTGRPLEEDPDADPRQLLVDWMVSKENPLFARALVNRYWKHFFGSGIVEPEDDLRESNPPSNAALLDALAKDFIESDYDLKQLIRRICNSTVYQLSAEPNAINQRDRQNFSRFQPRRLRAETLLDAIDLVLQTNTKFNGMRRGARAIDLPDEVDKQPQWMQEAKSRPLVKWGAENLQRLAPAEWAGRPRQEGSGLEQSRRRFEKLIEPEARSSRTGQKRVSMTVAGKKARALSATWSESITERASRA